MDHAVATLVGVSHWSHASDAYTVFRSFDFHCETVSLTMTESFP